MWTIAAVLGLTVTLAAWPGTMIGDNLRQLSEIRSGQLTDWHPPLMSVIWSALGTTPCVTCRTSAALPRVCTEDWFLSAWVRDGADESPHSMAVSSDAASSSRFLPKK